MHLSGASPRESRGYVTLLRENPDLRRLFLARVISSGGDWFTTIVLLSLAYEVSRSSLVTSLVVVASTVPAAAFAPLGGLLADRVNRKRLMVIAEILSGVVVLLMLLLSRGEALAGPLLCLVGLAVISAFFEPAAAAVLPEAIAEADLARANALMGSVWGIMIIVGAGLGGLVSALAGREVALLLDAASFFASAGLMSRLRSGGRNESVTHQSSSVSDSARGALEGARFVLSHAKASGFVLLRAAFGLQAGVLVVLSLTGSRLTPGNELGIGLLIGGRGVGSLVGTHVAGRISERHAERLLTYGALGGLIFGACYLLFSFAQSLGFALLLVVLAQAGSAMGYTIGAYGLQLHAPDGIRGRVMGFEMGVTWTAIVLSSLAFGHLFDISEMAPAVRAFGLVQVLFGAAVGLWSLLLQSKRQQRGSAQLPSSERA